MPVTVPTPSTAERVRSACITAGRATLAVDGAPTVGVVLHLVRGTGDVVLAVPQDSPVATPTCPGGASAVLELTDTAAVELREPVRCLVWLRGALHPVPDQHTLALEVAAELAHPALLDVGHGTVLLRLELTSAVVADSTGAEPVDAAVLLAAEPDPFCADEATWVRHLDGAHADLVGLLARRLPAQLRRGRVRLLGIDRYGVRLRVERDCGDATVRLPFSAPVVDAAALSRALRTLVGCPFLNGLHARS